MKPYSIEFREKVVKAYDSGGTSVRKIAARFDVSKAFVQRMLKQKQLKGHVEPGKQGGSMKGELAGYETKLAEMVDKHPDATLSEYCEYWGETHHQWLSISTMCRGLQKAQLTPKKKTLRSTQAATERVQKLRREKSLLKTSGSLKPTNCGEARH